MTGLPMWLARRQMLHFLLSWTAAALMLWRDWSRLPPPSSINAGMTLLGIVLATGVSGVAIWWLHWSPDLLFVAMALLTLALGAWRWQRLARYPQAFPVSRCT